ncbi:hypothetical protein HBA54_21540 [Pelagibius litoralis]|uniref:Uncharacterized protein n=1 Tax=Pelagibius litoralis TaxID=374515 RepID=A0A967KBM8_9PROT|nr:hypothetical protein [Pelagibius litoralis]NIA71187.1 hypothetical protein [Pelagibius litoralis]
MTENIWVSGLIGVFGAILGAASTFAFERMWSHSQEKKAQISAGHEAVFAIICAYDALKDYKDRVVDPVADHPIAWLLPPTSLVATPESFSKNLEFLFPDNGNLLHQLALESRRYKTALVAIENHVKFSFSEVQPALEKTGLVSANPSEVMQALGPRITGTAERNWQELCYQIEATSSSLLIALDSLHKVLACEFPEQKFMTVKEKSVPKTLQPN